MKHIKKILIGLSVLGTLLIGAAVVHASALPAEPTRFESSLVAPIGSTDTSMTLVGGTNNDGTPLSGFECFTIDSNQPNVEDVCGTVNGVSVTGMIRGISGSTGTTSVTALESSHRRGADVKISDEPFLVILSRIVNDIDGFANPVGYDGSVATSTLTQNRNNLVDWGLLQDTAFNVGAINNAGVAAKGVVQIATALQTASSTGAGSTGALLSIPASEATSSYQSATAALKVVVTQNNGKIDNNFLATSTFSYTLGLATSSITNIYTSTTSPGTWTEAAGAKMVQVILIGGGGGGKGGSNSSFGAGGGSGGYTSLFVPASLVTSPVTVTVGAGSAGTTGNSSPSAGGNTTFGAYASATGGSLNSGGVGTVTGTIAGTGGSSTGSAGTASVFNANLAGGIAGASAGSIPGGNGLSATSTFPVVGGSGGGGGNTNGGNGGLYGAGGGGGGETSGGNSMAGNGADGIAEVIQYF